jgi:hypothetical protein
MPRKRRGGQTVRSNRRYDKRVIIILKPSYYLLLLA